MTGKQSFGKRLMSILLCLAFLITMLPLSVLTASAASSVNITRVADPSTMDDWKNLFPLDELSTENAGGVWMDKSVFTDASAFAGTGITADGADSFLVALSAIAANRSITGMSNVPTDSILVLDVSGSMNDNSNDVAEELVEAANESIAALLETNKYNRVSVVVYSGTRASETNDDAAIVLLPLGRYTTVNGQYLDYTVTTSGRWETTTTETVSINENVVYEGTANKPAAQEKEVVGATYIQKGILGAVEQFLAEDIAVTVEDPAVGTLHRKPVLVLMSDGAPTLGSTNFTAPGQFDLGDGTQTSAALGFVSQLSAAYAKAMIEEKYGTDCLFYTLGLGISNDGVAIGVLDPGNANASPALDDFWEAYTAEGATSVTVQSRPTRTVSVIETKLEQDYVDRYFSAESETLEDGTVITMADKLKAAFREIVSAIQLQSTYFPTLISDNEDLSGYVSFVDRIGQYMEVTDIKGILIDNQLFSGAELASNFVPGGGNLGTYDNPTALGVEMVAAVRARIGLDSDDTARTLIGLAYEHGQLSYTDADNYSNYIGWYANAAGQFLGFYHEGVTVLPAATGDAATDPAFVIKSYGYLGAVDASQGVSESDMMYATVQVRENIATGEQIVAFAVPAALIPVVTYDVTLDANGVLSDLTVSGADEPIRLVYEVALQDGINAFNLTEAVSADYLAQAQNVNADGSVNFYTNQWDYQNATGYGTVNAYSYFNPSRQNDKYYYLEDTPIYADTNGTLYTGETQPTGTVYRSYQVYKNNGTLRTETIYRALSDAVKATAVRRDDGSWYVPRGNVHVNLDGYTVDKTVNVTATLGQANIPFVDTHNHSIDEEGYDFYVGATLGNNGKLVVTPETGLKLTKTMAPGAAAPTEPFTFTLTNLTNAADSTEYPAWLIRADGTQADTTVKFENGVATVQLDPGDVLYIGGMTAGDVFHIAENETAAYIAESTGLTDAGTVTVIGNETVSVAFVNADRGTGNLTIAKEVTHGFGVDYQIPADKTFTVTVTLSGVGTANATFTAAHTNGQYTEITTDADGRFTVTLKHGEGFEVLGLPAGTTAAVVETEYGAGFTPVYWENGVQDDGVVTVVRDATVSVIVENGYEAAEVYPVNITVAGEKLLRGRDWQEGDKFDFVLQKLLPDGTWQQLGETVSAVPGTTAFQFTDAFQNERYTEAGTYYYRVIELEPETPLGGVSYDKTVHSFSVIVTDADMDGKLEISEVRTDRPETTSVSGNATDGWSVFASFENTYSATGSATVTIDVNKVIENHGGAEQPLSGFVFGLFDPATGEQIGEPLTTTDRGFARFALNYGPEDVGSTYTYILKEIAPDPVPAGWTYSTQEILVTVRVTDNHDGTISAVIYIGSEQPEDAGTSITATFTNIYDPADTELAIDFVNKELTGRTMKAGEFTFEVQTLDGTVVLTGKNDATGKVTFDGTLKFSAAGTYYYNIVETSADGNGVATDKTTYRVTVTVTDSGGQLTASYVLVNAAGDTVTFRNTYTATPAEHVIRGTKTLRGRTLLNDEFTFVLTELTVDGAAVQDPESWSVKNFADGTFVFPAITYDKAGTYTYKVEEIIPEGGSAYGITYDRTQFKVTVVVKDDGVGNLYIESETVTLLNDSPASALVFVNDYAAAAASAQIQADKQLTGKVNNALVGGEFEFELYDSDANWTYSADTLRETVTNGPGGTIVFSEIDFETDEDRYFIVVEKNGGQTIDGITYDDTVYRVFVEVTDDLKGQLHATVHIYDSEGIPQDKILFVNVYEITGGDSVTLSGEKTIDGRDFQDGDAFTFELYEADESFSIGQTPKLTADMDPDTHRYQFDLNYTAEDAGKTFYYVLREKYAGQTIDGITYSEAEYRITVAVEDDGVGGIRTTVTVEHATTSTLNFVNVYESASVSVQFEGTKELTGKPLEDNAFTFDLIASDADWTVGEILQSVTNVDGKLLFEAIAYSEPGDYYYLVTERGAGQTVGGITYDDTVYHVFVEVTDDLKGQLHATVHIYDSEGVPQDNILFVNVCEITVGDITVDINVHKTVVNKGSGSIGPEGFEFILENLADSADRLTATSDAEGNAKFTLTFTEDDIGKTYRYRLTEVNGGRENVQYSTAEYLISITVTLDEENDLVATVTKDEVAETEIVAEFENVYDDTPVPSIPEVPKTGDGAHLGLWIALMTVSGGAVITLAADDSKRRKEKR